MPISINWDSQIDNVVYYKFEGAWSWQDFLMAFEEEQRMAESVAPQRYDVIGDLTSSNPLPQGSGISHVYSIFKRYPPNWGCTMIVTTNAFARTLFTVGVRVHPDTHDGFRLARTITEARQVIHTARTEQAELLEDTNPQSGNDR